MFGNPFYHETIKRIIIGFGSVFNNIIITREDSNGVEERRFPIPIQHLQKRKFHRILLEKVAEENNNPNIQTYLPKMAFYIADINAMPDKQTLPRDIWQNNADGTTTRVPIRTPYRIVMELGIFTKKQEDGYKILEQILPYFKPSLTMSLKTTQNMETVVRDDIVMNLQDVSRDYDLEGSLADSDLDVYIWTLSFSMDFFMYGPPVTNGSGIIRTVDVDFIEGGTGKKMSHVVVSVDPIDADFASYGVSSGSFLYTDDYDIITSASLGTSTGLLP